jgi:hypothetical protein
VQVHPAGGLKGRLALGGVGLGTPGIFFPGDPLGCLLALQEPGSAQPRGGLALPVGGSLMRTSLDRVWLSHREDDSAEPITSKTLRAAREVGKILKYVDENDAIEPRYAHYK